MAVFRPVLPHKQIPFPYSALQLPERSERRSYNHSSFAEHHGSTHSSVGRTVGGHRRRIVELFREAEISSGVSPCTSGRRPNVCRAVRRLSEVRRKPPCGVESRKIVCRSAQSTDSREVLVGFKGNSRCTVGKNWKV